MLQIPRRSAARTRPGARVQTQTGKVMRYSRRHALLLLGGLVLSPQVVRAAVPKTGRIDFEVLRDGEPIGHHRLRFERRDGRLHVDIEIKLDVTFTFVTLYYYRHRNHEVWEGDRLISLETRTDDNGDAYRVSAQAKGDKLIVEGSAGRLELPGDTLPTSYWHEQMVERGEWLDTQKGRLVRSEVTSLGAETIRSRGDEIEATRYALRGDLDCDLWYRDGHWQKLRFSISGSTIDYVRQPQSGTGA